MVLLVLSLLCWDVSGQAPNVRDRLQALHRQREQKQKVLEEERSRFLDQQRQREEEQRRQHEAMQREEFIQQQADAMEAEVQQQQRQEAQEQQQQEESQQQQRGGEEQQPPPPQPPTDPPVPIPAEGDGDTTPPVESPPSPTPFFDRRTGAEPSLDSPLTTPPETVEESPPPMMPGRRGRRSARHMEELKRIDETNTPPPVFPNEVQPLPVESSEGSVEQRVGEERVSHEEEERRWTGERSRLAQEEETARQEAAVSQPTQDQLTQPVEPLSTEQPPYQDEVVSPPPPADEPPSLPVEDAAAPATPHSEVEPPASSDPPMTHEEDRVDVPAHEPTVISPPEQPHLADPPHGLREEEAIPPTPIEEVTAPPPAPESVEVEIPASSGSAFGVDSFMGASSIPSTFEAASAAPPPPVVPSIDTAAARAAVDVATPPSPPSPPSPSPAAALTLCVAVSAVFGCAVADLTWAPSLTPLPPYTASRDSRGRHRRRLPPSLSAGRWRPSRRGLEEGTRKRRSGQLSHWFTWNSRHCSSTSTFPYSLAVRRSSELGLSSTPLHNVVL